MSKVILLSGGMDSFISYSLWGDNHIPVFIKNLSSYTEQDYQKALLLCGSKLVVINTASNLVELPNTSVVPHRNMIMMGVVANVMGASEIMISSPRGEIIADQQPAFYKRLQSIMGNVKITNPIGRYTKTQAVRKYVRESGSFARKRIVSHSRSCYSASTWGQCGQCAACFKRFVAFELNGVSDKFNYPPALYPLAVKGEGNLTFSNMAAYGIRPTWEAWKAVRRYV
jgi:7-cyano-7-deazaguanine synthase